MLTSFLRRNDRKGAKMPESAVVTKTRHLPYGLLIHYLGYLRCRTHCEFGV
jgi:hypothetical protein